MKTPAWVDVVKTNPVLEELSCNSTAGGRSNWGIGQRCDHKYRHYSLVAIEALNLFCGKIHAFVHFNSIILDFPPALPGISSMHLPPNLCP